MEGTNQDGKGNKAIWFGEWGVLNGNIYVPKEITVFRRQKTF